MTSSSKKFNFNATLDDLTYQERLHYASTGQIQKLDNLNPTFSQDEIEQLIVSAKNQAMAEAQGSIGVQTNELVQQMIESVRAIYEQQQDLESHFYESALGFTSALLTKILPKMAADHGFSELEQDLKEKLLTVLQKPKLTIKLHPEIYEQLGPKIQEMALSQGFEGKLNCLAEASLGRLDYQIHWEEGGIERNTQRLFEELDKIAQPFIEATFKEKDINSDQTGV